MTRSQRSPERIAHLLDLAYRLGLRIEAIVDDHVVISLPDGYGRREELIAHELCRCPDEVASAIVGGAMTELLADLGESP